MRDLSVFVDESGTQEGMTEYYVVTYVLHDQADDFSRQLFYGIDRRRGDYGCRDTRGGAILSNSKSRSVMEVKIVKGDCPLLYHSSDSLPLAGTHSFSA